MTDDIDLSFFLDTLYDDEVLYRAVLNSEPLGRFIFMDHDLELVAVKVDQRVLPMWEPLVLEASPVLLLVLFGDQYVDRQPPVPLEENPDSIPSEVTSEIERGMHVMFTVSRIVRERMEHIELA